MPIDPNIALGFQKPKLAGPQDVISLQNLALQRDMNQLQLAQAPMKMKLAEFGMLKEQQEMQEKAAKRRQELSTEVNQRAFNAFNVAKSRGAADDVAEHEMRRAYLEALDEQETSGLLGIAGISKDQIGKARATIPSFADIQAKVLSPEKAQEKADYAATAPQVPLSQVKEAGMQPPVMPPAGVEADLLGNGPIRTPAQNAPVTTPEIEVTAKPPVDSPDSLRKEAKRLEAMGTKVAFERAKEVRAEADRLDKLSFDSEARELADKKFKLDQQKFEFDKIKEQADQKSKGLTASQKDKELTTKLSDDYEKNQAVKDYKTVQPLIASMENAYKKNSGAADLDMVYALAKIYDPGSVVREGEQVLVVKSGGLPSQVQDWIGWVNGGQRLSTDVRKGMVEQAKSRADNYKQAADAIADSYTRQAKEWNLNPENIVRRYSVTAREGVAPGQGPRKEAPKRRASDATKTIDFNDLK